MQIEDRTILAPENAERRIASSPALYRALVGGETARFAVLRGATSVKQAEAYLPGNYHLCESFMVADGDKTPKLVVIIGGTDNAGWTLDDYVIPRYASGLIWATEIV